MLLVGIVLFAGHSASAQTFTLTLQPKKPTAVNYLMAVAAIPAGFDRVAAIRPAPGGVELVAVSGKRVPCALDLTFLAAGGA